MLRCSRTTVEKRPESLKPGVRQTRRICLQSLEKHRMILYNSCVYFIYPRFEKVTQFNTSQEDYNEEDHCIGA